MLRGWVVSQDYRSLIDILRNHRMELGVSQRELARRLNKPPSFVNKIELLERRLDILEFLAIANALEIDPTIMISRMADAISDNIKL